MSDSTNHSAFRRWTSNLGLSIGFSIIGFLFAEIVLRLTGYEGDYERKLFKFAAPYSIVRKDSWVLKSDAQAHDGKISIGGTRVALRKNPGEKRVLLIGDSVTEGYGVESSATFAARLGVLRGPGVSILNAGVYGFNTCDEYKLYSEQLRDLEADTVVLGLFPANDLNFNLLGSARLDTYPRWIETLWQHAEDHSAFLHFGYLSAFAINHRFRFRTASAEASSFSRIGLIENESRLHLLHYREGEIAGYLPQESELMHHAYDLLEGLLSRFQRDSSKRSASLIVLILPSPATVAGNYYSPVEPNILQTLGARGIQIQPGELDVSRPRHTILKICSRLRLTCLDATPALQAVGRTAFLPGDDHLSDVGHAAVAQLLARQF